MQRLQVAKQGLELQAAVASFLTQASIAEVYVLMGTRDKEASECEVLQGV